MTGLHPVSFKKGRASAPRLSKPYVPGKHSDRYWSDDEQEILRRYFPTGGASAVKAHLPNRSTQAIWNEAKKLKIDRIGVTAPKTRIDPPADIDDQIRARWPELKGRGAVSAYADELGLPRWWLTKRATKLGLTTTHKKEPNWTDAEKALMTKAPLHDLDRCAAMFHEHGFNRSPTSISVMAKRLKISRRAARTTLSGTGAAGLLGLDNKTVTQWCVAGDLKAARRGSKRLPQQGGDAWEIQPHDLREFILENLAHIDIRKVEKVSFCALLARCPHCESALETLNR